MIRFSFSTAGLYPRLTEEAVRLVEEAGFPFVEIMPQSLSETTPEFGKFLNNILTDTRVGSIHFPLISFATFYNGYPKMQEESKELIDNITEMGGILGVEVIVIHPPFFRHEIEEKISKKVVIENLRYLGEKAKEHGIKVALENSPKGGRNPIEIRNVLREIGSSNVFPMIDTTEAVESEEDPVKWLKEEKDIIHLHVSDHRGEKKHLIPGDGDTDWYGIINTLLERKYENLFVIEPLYSLFIEDPLPKLKNALSFFKKIEKECMENR